MVVPPDGMDARPDGDVSVDTEFHFVRMNGRCRENGFGGGLVFWIVLLGLGDRDDTEDVWNGSEERERRKVGQDQLNME